jgi:hypothetical protein
LTGCETYLIYLRLKDTKAKLTVQFTKQMPTRFFLKCYFRRHFHYASGKQRHILISPIRPVIVHIRCYVYIIPAISMNIPLFKVNKRMIKLRNLPEAELTCNFGTIFIPSIKFHQHRFTAVCNLQELGVGNHATRGEILVKCRRIHSTP